MVEDSATIAGALAAALGLTALVQAALVAGALVVRARARARVGAPLQAGSPPLQPLARRGSLVLLALLAALAALTPGVSFGPASVVLGLAGVSLLLSPPANEAVVGEHGVRSGWHAAGYEELAEWRLTGEHLRWRAGTGWHSVPLAPEHHAAARARLAERAPDRESRFAR